MLGELTLGEAEYDAILKLNTPLHRGRGWGWVCSIAAVLLVGLFLYQQLPTDNTNEVPHYYTSDFSAGSTLRNVYTGRQHQENHLSYTRFKTMLNENK
jgi:hypothetical protein